MKKMLIVTAILLSLFSTSRIAGADYEIPLDIRVNDSFIKTDVNSFIEDGTTYVPIRFVSEALDADVKWFDESKTAQIHSNDKKIVIKQNMAYVNGEKVSIKTKNINGRFFVPVRWISNQLGASINWDNKYHMINIYKNGINVANTDTAYNMDDIYWMGRIIEAESGGESMTGKIAVGNVILNRVGSSDYPDTIYGVIFDRKYGVQFEPIMNGTIYNEPSKNSIAAAKLSLKGTNIVDDCLYFLNPTIATSSWITNNRTFYKTIGNHDFYI